MAVTRKVAHLLDKIMKSWVSILTGAVLMLHHQSSESLVPKQGQHHSTSKETTFLANRRSFTFSRASFVSDGIEKSSFLLLGSFNLLLASSPKIAGAVETIGKDPNCNDASCLGVWDGLFADCVHTAKNPTTMILSNAKAGCVSSQDDTSGIFAEPWDYSEDVAFGSLEDTNAMVQPIMERIVHAVQKISDHRGDYLEIVLQEQRYLHVSFIDGQTGEISDGEFYITPNDTTIQFRLASSSKTAVNRGTVGRRLIGKSLRNMERAEMIRKELRWLKLPVLRNRQRALFFVESELDTFGPQSAALGPPEEMKINDINGARR
jgi:uncharacterized protein (DUF1499 family)